MHQSTPCCLGRTCALGLLLVLASCEGCSTAGQPCEANEDCANDQLCVSGYCRVVCNFYEDCGDGELCSDGVCIPRTGAGVADAARLDAEETDAAAGDLGGADRAAQDRRFVDGARPEVVVSDASGSADSGAVDAVSPDGGVEDGGAPDLGASDLGAPDQNAADLSAPDRSLPDNYLNTPPTILIGTVLAPTYPSSVDQSFPLSAAVIVTDAESEAPYSVVVIDGDVGCSYSQGQLVFDPPPGFVGTATCTIQVTDSGQPPATSAPAVVEFEVLAPYASCYWILADPRLASLGIGTEDGRYPIDPDGPGGAAPFDAYCDMNTLGGGWTLALRARDEASVGYSDSYWTDPSDSLGDLPDPRYGPSEKYEPFNRLAFSEVLVGMIAEGDAVDPADPNAVPVFAFHQLSISGASLLDVFTEDRTLATRPTQRDRDAWLGLIPGATLQANCNAEGLAVNGFAGEAWVRVGISANEQVDCLTNDSFIGVGGLGAAGTTVTVGVNTTQNLGQDAQLSAFAVVYLRDSGIADQAVRPSCMAHRLAGASTDGLYAIDPDAAGGSRPVTTYCDMSSYGGGWSLIGVNAGGGEWSTTTVLGDRSFVTPTLEEDFRSLAWRSYAFDDLLIRGAAAPHEHVLYEGLGSQSSSMLSWINSVAPSACASTEPIGYGARAGDLSASNLCERSLYLSPEDQDGDVNDCAGPQAAVGPAWSAVRSDQCPMDDPEYSAFVLRDGHLSPFGDSPVQVWARDVDFTALGVEASCQVHADLGRDISGRYLVRDGDGGAQEVYCLMRADQGWMRVADVDMGHDDTCPGDWQYRDSPRACERHPISSATEIRSASFSTLGLSYQQVRGYLRGYQSGTTDAFDGDSSDIDGQYMDGVSITHGPDGGRTHIWSYAFGGRDEAGAIEACPCLGGAAPPAFVGSDYYCDNAMAGNTPPVAGTVYAGNLLFDGISGSSCAPPDDPAWFEHSLPALTSDDVEVRLIGTQAGSAEDICLLRLELFVR